VNLAELLDRYGDAIGQTVIRTYPPLYDADVRRVSAPALEQLLRRPLGAQADAINATVLSLKQRSSSIVVGEMGTGKSYIAAAAASLAGCRRILILCPPHLVNKWRREVLQTVAGARASIVRSISDLERIRRHDGANEFAVCSRERAKLGYRWAPAVIPRPLHDARGGLSSGNDGRFLALLSCSTCFAAVTDDEDIPLTWAELRTKKRRCRACGGPLWQADRTGPRRMALADYVRRRMPDFFDLLIVDEGHEFKARGSAQGLAAEALAGACGKTLTLTGTLFGGYSSTLFYLLWRFSPAVRREFGYREESRWISRYGVVERITRKCPDAYGEDGRHSKRRSYLTRTVEKPGVSPAVLFHVIGNTVFLRLTDVARDLPTYTERVEVCALDGGHEPEAPSQESSYQRLASELRHATAAALHAGSKRLLASYLQALLAYPDACTRGETVLDSESGNVVAHAPALSDEVSYPKERALIELALRERTRGRRLLVYITHTERRDISPRLRTVLERAGLRVSVLKSDTVAPDRREEWLSCQVREEAEVLICHPRLVQTGLDLVDWPSICWYETDYSVYVLRQASRRSWRIGQRLPVEVTFLVYKGTLQAQALALVAAKMRSALMIEGELSEHGLAALDGDGHDVLLALARRLTERGECDDVSFETLCVRTAEAEGETTGNLVDRDLGGAEPSAGELEVDGRLASPLIGTPSGLPLPEGGLADGKPISVDGRSVRLEDVAHLIRRSRARRRDVPTTQLPLFTD
jgi:hypothetical protein